MSTRSSRWPAGPTDVLTREMLAEFQRLVARVYMLIGEVQGKTLLPLPPVALSSEELAASDKEQVALIESTLQSWSRQIKTVLNTELEQARTPAHRRCMVHSPCAPT